MNFQREYLGYCINNTADMLWLWYDYHTEIFDRSLPYTVVAPDDETTAIPTRFPYTSWSNNNAQKLLNDIYWIANAHGVSAEEMFRAKMSEVRGKSSSQDRIDLFLKLDKKGQFEFIKDVNN
ncbi:hypothetical protein KM776_11115 [Bacillus velezensis]|nr:hypothetical protein [Bacillus velezensis]QWK23481.1 hypothetical protein KM776_11115 [Bacillus velezensis]